MTHTYIWSALLGIICIVLAGVDSINAQDDTPGAVLAIKKPLVLSEAFMCERVVDQMPYNPAVIFSPEMKNVYCFTAFGVVPEKNIIWHTWFRRDKLVTKVKLVVEPPQWNTYSGIHIRESDKGPWRVEIRDHNDKLMGVRRFSISN